MQQLRRRAAEVRRGTTQQHVDGHLVPVEAKLGQQVEHDVRGHHLGQTGNLSLNLLLLGEHYLAGIDIHHDPTPCRNEGRRIIQIKVLRHRPQVLVVARVIYRVQDVLPTVELVLVLLLDLLPPLHVVDHLAAVAARVGVAAVVRVAVPALPVGGSVVVLEVTIVIMVTTGMAHFHQ